MAIFENVCKLFWKHLELIVRQTGYVTEVEPKRILIFVGSNSFYGYGMFFDLQPYI